MAKVNWKRLGITSGILLALAVFYGFAAYKKYDATQGELNRTASRLEEARRKAKEAGILLEISDIMTEQRKKGLVDFLDFESFNQILIDRPTLEAALIQSDKRHLLADELNASPEAFDVLYRSASMEGVSFPIDWERGLLASKMEQRCVIRMVNFASAAALVALEQGEQEEAWRRLRAGAAVMSQFKDEPVSDSVFAWSTAAIRLMKTVYGIIERDPSNAMAIRSTLSLIDQIGDPQSIESVLPGDILKYLVTARDFDDYDDNQILSIVADPVETIPIPSGKNMPAAFETAALEFWTGVLDEIKGIENDIEQGIELDRLGLAWGTDERPSQFLSIAFPATYEQLGKQIAKVKQMMRLLHTVCAVVAEWQATGELPDTLADDGLWTTDPLMEEPFHYQKIVDGFRLQALGVVSLGSVKPPIRDLLWLPGQGYGLDFTFASSDDPSS